MLVRRVMDVDVLVPVRMRVSVVGGVDGCCVRQL